MPSLLAFGGKRTRHRRDHARLNARPSVWDVSANTSRENGRAPEPAWYPFLEIRSWFGLPVPGPAAGFGSGPPAPAPGSPCGGFGTDSPPHPPRALRARPRRRRKSDPSIGCEATRGGTSRRGPCRRRRGRQQDGYAKGPVYWRYGVSIGGCAGGGACSGPRPRGSSPLSSPSLNHLAAM